MSVRCGLDRIAERLPRRLRGARVGLVAHPASVTRDLRHAIPAIAGCGLRLRAVFGPEHGLGGTEQDLRPVESDSLRKLPVHSLYGDRLGPTREMLAGLDALLFDLQDVGSRYYTYISTLHYCLRACAEAGVELIVLDRPNPINGVQIEGNLVEQAHLSYVGIHPLPARHGMTVGEIGGMFVTELGIAADLTVCPAQGWSRSAWFDQTGLPWVMPSPNMPTLDTATVYPGMCLLEGTNLSEGRGTTRPFEIFGAPWLDTRRLARFLHQCRLPGVAFREIRFKPTFNKHAGRVCAGFQIHVLDRRRFLPYRTGLAIVQGSLMLHRRPFAWRQPPYEYETEKLPIDILLGNGRIRESMEQELKLENIVRSWRGDLEGFRRRRRRFLLYS